MNFAALELGVLNTIVVEALNRSPGSPGGATRRPTSNHNGHLSAPGGDILSTVLPPTLYDTKGGTSMAAPHVAGLAGFLLAVDPGLTTAQLWELLLTNTVPVAGGASPRVDAFTAVMDVDRLRGDSEVLRMLVDMDDGTPDGNLRVDPDDESGVDHTEDDADEDGGIGDGDIDMSDFPRWRDGYLALAYGGIAGAIELDGSDAHPKKDLNGNGRTESERDDESVYPFVDLNGDNRTDDSAADVPSLGSVTDLEMLENVFDDPHYVSADLEGLLASMDIAIRPAKLLDAGEAADIHSSVRPVDAEAAEDDPKFRRIHTGDEFAGEGLWQVYTVPAYEEDGTTERTYTARVIALDAAGDTIADLERDFTGKRGQDHFWDPAVIEVAVTPEAVTLTPGETRQFTATVTGSDNAAGRPVATGWTYVTTFTSQVPRPGKWQAPGTCGWSFISRDGATPPLERTTPAAVPLTGSRPPAPAGPGGKRTPAPAPVPAGAWSCGGCNAG